MVVNVESACGRAYAIAAAYPYPPDTSGSRIDEDDGSTDSGTSRIDRYAYIVPAAPSAKSEGKRWSDQRRPCRYILCALVPDISLLPVTWMQILVARGLDVCILSFLETQHIRNRGPDHDPYRRNDDGRDGTATNAG